MSPIYDRVRRGPRYRAESPTQGPAPDPFIDRARWPTNGGEYRTSKEKRIYAPGRGLGSPAACSLHPYPEETDIEILSFL